MESRNGVDKDEVDERDSVVFSGKSAELEGKNSSFDNFSRKNPEHIIVLKSGKQQKDNCSDQQLYVQKISALENKIPKYVVSLDEKYLLRCLEWMHVSAFKSTLCDIPANIGILSTSFSSRGCTLDMARLAVECPCLGVKDSVLVKDMVASPTIGNTILGTITGSKSMMNILRSPLLHQLAALDSQVNVGRQSLVDSKSTMAPDLSRSPVRFKTSSPKKLKEMVLKDDRYETNHMLERLAYSSSVSSSSSDKSSTVADVVSHGMLKCTWKDGLPNYMFSVDDLGEVYVSSLNKIQSPDYKFMDYVYNFHLKAGGKREHGLLGVQLNFVGKMEVSTSVSLCPQNAEILETRFVLFGSGDNDAEELQTSAQTPRKSKGLKKKVADVIRTGHTRKKMNPSKYSTTSIILEDTPSEPSEEVNISSNHLRGNIPENSMPPNLELAVIVVRNHVHYAPKKQAIGGWGLNFLKISGNKEANVLREPSASSETNQRDSGECSTSMNVLVPAGYHGGPRTRNGGPSSIMERWTSGGHCDCGGWDLGCPLTVLSNKPCRQEISPPLDRAGDSNAVDLFVEGSKQTSPIMKMSNIHEDLYYIQFHSTLSALQCFSIATAVIHNKTPALRPKPYTN